MNMSELAGVATAGVLVGLLWDLIGNNGTKSM